MLPLLALAVVCVHGGVVSAGAAGGALGPAGPVVPPSDATVAPGLPVLALALGDRLVTCAFANLTGTFLFEGLWQYVGVWGGIVCVVAGWTSVCGGSAWECGVAVCRLPPCVPL